MINAQELRIGNLLQIDGEIIPVGYFLLSELYVAWKGGHTVTRAKEFQYVPITEKRLERLGFQKEFGAGKDIKWSLVIGRKEFIVATAQGTDLLLLYRGDIGLCFYDLDLVEYVHELQNVIYALAKTEVPYRPE